MKYLIMALSLLVTPFFSQAFDIFQDGTVDIKSPGSKDIYIIIGVSNPAFDYLIGETDVDAEGICQSNHTESEVNRNYNGYIQEGGSTDDVISYWVVCTFDYWDGWGGWHKVDDRESNFFNYTLQIKPVLFCPPQNHPTYTTPKSDPEGKIEGCFDPAQASSVDECNLNSTNQYLAIPVDEPSACFTTGNGSQCKYDAVDMGDGVTAYALDLEGDCYSEELPNLNGDPSEADTPNGSDDMCKDWGNGMICPEKPENVCNSLGECDKGCGTVNGIFVCIDSDLDGDGIPNYLDPDVDGDGIRNDIDLDNNGDGVDDAIDLSKPEDTDLGPIISELKVANKELKGIGEGMDMLNNDFKFLAKDVEDIKESITKVDIPLRDKPKEGLKSFWETDYPEGLKGVVDEKMAEAQGTEFFTFLEQFQVSVGGSSANFDMCFNLGAMGNFGCHNFNVDPRTFPAIKIFILISAAFLCRRILFGG